MSIIFRGKCEKCGHEFEERSPCPKCGGKKMKILYPVGYFHRLKDLLPLKSKELENVDFIKEKFEKYSKNKLAFMYVHPQYYCFEGYMWFKNTFETPEEYRTWLINKIKESSKEEINKWTCLYLGSICESALIEKLVEKNILTFINCLGEDEEYIRKITENEKSRGYNLIEWGTDQGELGEEEIKDFSRMIKALNVKKIYCFGGVWEGCLSIAHESVEEIMNAKLITTASILGTDLIKKISKEPTAEIYAKQITGKVVLAADNEIERITGISLNSLWNEKLKELRKEL